MCLFSIEGLAQTGPPNMGSCVVSKISLNGDYLYLSDLLTKNFTLCKLPLQDKYSRPLVNKLDYLVVRDGVIFYSRGRACIPELWNSDVTECLSFFDQLTHTTKCLSVSDEVIACVCKQTATKCRIIFFNVSTKEILENVIFRAKFRLNIIVYACSIKYDVHVRVGHGFGTSLSKDGEKMD